MPERVVDLLEQVEIEKEDRRRPIRLAGQHLLENRGEARAVEKAGQRVVVRHRQEFVACAARLRDVAEEDREPSPPGQALTSSQVSACSR